MKHRLSLAAETISGQLSAISAFNRISRLAEILKRYTFHMSRKRRSFRAIGYQL
jgi:hypothetical protein